MWINARGFVRLGDAAALHDDGPFCEPRRPSPSISLIGAHRLRVHCPASDRPVAATALPPAHAPNKPAHALLSRARPALSCAVHSSTTYLPTRVGGQVRGGVGGPPAAVSAMCAASVARRCGFQHRRPRPRPRPPHSRRRMRRSIPRTPRARAAARARAACTTRARDGWGGSGGRASTRCSATRCSAGGTASCIAPSCCRRVGRFREYRGVLWVLLWALS